MYKHQQCDQMLKKVHFLRLQAVFTLNSGVFQNNKYLGYFYKEVCYQELPNLVTLTSTTRTLIVQFGLKDFEFGDQTFSD